jgi:hypothetical protein
MSYLLNRVRNTAIGTGILCWFLAASTSDYYVMELHQPEPNSVAHMLIAGAAFIAGGLLIHWINKKGENYESEM